MKVIKHKFKNNGIGTYNDDVLERIFDLSKISFRVYIKPVNSTSFWRVGIRLSTTPDIEFFHPSARYKRPEHDKYIDINIGVGEWDGKEWDLPHRIHLAQYNMITGQNEHILHRSDEYLGNFLEWNISQALSRQNTVLLSCYFEENGKFEGAYKIDKSYRYFKLYAWSDQNPFNIEVEIEIRDKYTSNTPDQSKPKHKIATNSFYITDQFNPVIGVREIAKEIGELLKRLLDQKGNMFGIFGQWGRGKTFLWQEISMYLDKKDGDKTSFLKVEFHAWKYQDTPASWAYLYETLADKYFNTENHRLFKHKKIQAKLNNTQNFWIRYFGWFQEVIAIVKDKVNIISKKIRLNGVRLGVKPVIYFVFGFFLFLVWLFMIPIEKKVEWAKYLISTYGIVVIIKLLYLYFIYQPKAKDVLNMYSEKVSFQKYLGLQAEIQKEIVFLFKAWIPEHRIKENKILLFVDDIDRCDENRVMQVVDSLKVMLEDIEISKRLIILAALDEQVLKMAIIEKYRKMVFESSDKEKSEKYNILLALTKEYIDKIFLAGIKLGHLSQLEKAQIFDSITEGRVSTISLEPKEIVEIEETESFKEATVVVIKDTDKAKNIVTEEYMMTEDEKYDIGQIEYNFLKEALNFFDDPTPRNIRIYYYRYMLAKNILKHKITDASSLYDAWLVCKKKILAYLIVFYSSKLNSLLIKDDCIKAFNSKDDEFKLSLFNINFEIDRLLYLQILKIIEMVVPY